MAESLSPRETAKSVEKSTREDKENSSTWKRVRLPVPHLIPQENRTKKNSAGSSNMVDGLITRYEEISNSQRNIMAAGAQKTGNASGTIKKTVVNNKRVSFTDNSSAVTKIRKESENDTVARKRGENSNAGEDHFTRSKFNIYVDEQPPRKVEAKAIKVVSKLENFSNSHHALPSRQPFAISESAFDHRLTPNECLPIQPKKVKVQRRKGPIIAAPSIPNQPGSMWPAPEIQLAYVENFVDLELEKDKPLSRISRGFRENNITPSQRNIIIKFLTRLHAHSFYPSIFLHQTVRIFDAVLDAKVFPVEEFQLVALAAMWIALKREQIAYDVPSAKVMISYAKDLYAGRVDLLLKSEREVLQLLNFEIAFPDSFGIMYYYMIKNQSSCLLQSNELRVAYYCGGYMLDLSLVDQDLMKKSPALLAAAAAELALFIVIGGEKNYFKPRWVHWRSSDAVNRFHEEQIREVRSTFIRQIVDSSIRHSDGEIVFKKYSRSRYGKISQFLGKKVLLLLNEDESA